MASIDRGFYTLEERIFYVLLLLGGGVTAAGLFAAHTMEEHGHAITGMTNQVVWGLPHVFAIFMIVAASGVLNVASIGSVFGQAMYKPRAPLSGLLSLALLAGGLSVLMLDLGRPDRVIVGEIRGGEALDIVQAMTSGHGGCMGTLHASYPKDTLTRLETMAMMSDVEMPLAAMRSQIGSGVQMIVQCSRLQDGSRKVTHITEVIGMEGDVVTLQNLILFDISGEDANGRILGRHRSTGIARPRFWDRAVYFGQETKLAEALASAELFRGRAQLDAVPVVSFQHQVPRLPMALIIARPAVLGGGLHRALEQELASAPVGAVPVMVENDRVDDPAELRRGVVVVKAARDAAASQAVKIAMKTSRHRLKQMQQTNQPRRPPRGRR